MLPKIMFASDAEYQAYRRDWFAGQALSAALVGSYSGETLTDLMAQTIAEESYLVADAMMEARKGGTAS